MPAVDVTLTAPATPASPTLRGYVNPVPVAAEEHLSRGDVASVVVQYHDRRTLLMPANVPITARAHRRCWSSCAGA
jgi:hypothetical protein